MTRQVYYDATGSGYATSRYGDPHMQMYLAQRSETLGRIIRQHFGAERPLRILEVGCGPGLSLAYLSTLEARHSLSGIDFSSTMIEEAINRTSDLDPVPSLQVADAFDLPFEDNAFDFAYSTRMIHQFSHEDKKRVVGEMRRVVNGDGLLTIEFYARPYRWLRYVLARNTAETREQYFEHYPSTQEVRDLIGQPYRRLPVRIGGAGTLHRFAGASVVRAATRLASAWPFRIITDEYFVVTRN